MKGKKDVDLLTAFLGILMVIIVLISSSCSTLSLPSDPTPEQRKSAICEDARDGLILADLSLVLVDLKPEYKKYWEAFRQGCIDKIHSYCGE